MGCAQTKYASTPAGNAGGEKPQMNSTATMVAVSHGPANVAGGQTGVPPTDSTQGQASMKPDASVPTKMSHTDIEDSKNLVIPAVAQAVDLHPVPVAVSDTVTTPSVEKLTQVAAAAAAEGVLTHATAEIPADPIVHAVADAAIEPYTPSTTEAAVENTIAHAMSHVAVEAPVEAIAGSVANVISEVHLETVMNSVQAPMEAAMNDPEVSVGAIAGSVAPVAVDASTHVAPQLTAVFVEPIAESAQENAVGEASESGILLRTDARGGVPSPGAAVDMGPSEGKAIVDDMIDNLLHTVAESECAKVEERAMEAEGGREGEAHPTLHKQPAAMVPDELQGVNESVTNVMSPGSDGAPASHIVDEHHVSNVSPTVNVSAEQLLQSADASEKAVSSSVVRATKVVMKTPPRP